VTKIISIVLPDLRGGGAERVNISLAHEFTAFGYEVEFVLMRVQGEFLKEVEQSFSVVDLAAPRVRNLPFALLKYIRRRRPMALMVAMWPLTVIAPICATLVGHRVKVLISEHGMLSTQYIAWGFVHNAMLKLSTSLGYRLAHKRVGVSMGVAQDMAALSWMPLKYFDVIYNPVPAAVTPTNNAIKVAEKWWDVPSGGRFLTVGNMKEVKNHPLLLRAFARVDRTDARLMILGDGAGRDALLNLADNLGITDRVIFPGFQRDPTPFYETADVFVLSSNSEGFGNVLVEALSFGTPVISTDCPSGPAEILDGGRFGQLVPVGDVEALALSMSSAFNLKPDFNDLKLRAADFAPQIAARKYLDLLGL
jgi:glycosyltransferase involved in cell wall biosynthesis